MAEPRPVTWVREGNCIRCTSHDGIEGYPYLTRNGRHMAMARWILWRRYKGNIPPGIISRHTCDNAWCINPRHIISGTIADNNRDKMERGRSCRGEKRSNAKLTDEAVRAIRARTEATDKALSQEFGITTSGIWRIRHRVTWKHVEQQETTMSNPNTERDERVKEIRERRARVENVNLDYATSDTGTRCVGYIYEKDTGKTVAQMSDLYDVMRGQFFANAAADIDYLLSLLGSQAAEVCLHCERPIRRIGSAWLHVESKLVSCRRGKSQEHSGIYRAEPMTPEAIATRMRDRCVQELKSLIDAEQSKHPSAHVAVRRMALHDAITALQSLTREQEK